MFILKIVPLDSFYHEKVGWSNKDSCLDDSLVGERSVKFFFVKDFLGEIGIPVVLDSGAKERMYIVEKLEVSSGFL
jgi:hypothetical protein